MDNNQIANEVVNSMMEDSPAKNLEAELKKMDKDQLKHFLFEKNSDEKISVEDMNALIKQMREMVGTMETMWNNYRNQYNITDEHIKKLNEFNISHRMTEQEFNESKTEGEDEKTFDPLNGLLKLTEADVIEIFGKDSLIIDPDNHEETIKTIKEVLESFLVWLKSLNQFKEIYNSYMKLLEENEKSQMDQLRELAEKETDTEKKAKMQTALTEYYKIKYLDFLKEPIEEKTINYICTYYTNQEKMNYMINRTRETLTKNGFSNAFILEMSKFETRFLDEKYHAQDNILLTWFFYRVVYGDLKTKGSKDKAMISSFVITMNQFIMNQLTDEAKARVLENIITFEDQMLEPVAKVLAEHKAKKASEEAVVEAANKIVEMSLEKEAELTASKEDEESDPLPECTNDCKYCPNKNQSENNQLE